VRPKDNRAAIAFLDLAPIKRAEGVVDLPGSKSISNRTLLLAALARARHGSPGCSMPTTSIACSTRWPRSASA
jgi:hypothetical protein